MRKLLKQSTGWDQRTNYTTLLMDSTTSPASQCSNPKMSKYSFEHGLLLHRHQIVVPQDLALLREIICSHHNSKLAGHPGRAVETTLLIM
ncbi:uncharacterized protein VP01_9222g1, partial [Puccinia sorghi]